MQSRLGQNEGNGRKIIDFGLSQRQFLLSKNISGLRGDMVILGGDMVILGKDIQLHSRRETDKNRNLKARPYFILQIKNK